MRFVFALLIGAVLLSGCDSPIVKDTFMSVDKLKKTKKFVGYDIVIGPVLLSGLEPNMTEGEFAESEDKTIPHDCRFLIPADWADKAELEIEGPLRTTREINAVIRMETKDLFHRRVKVGDNYYYFKLTDNVKGYGFKFVSVRNNNNELAVIVLKTVAEVPSWDDPANRVGQGVDPNYKRRGGKKSNKKASEDAKKKEEDGESSGDGDGGESKDEEG